MGRGGTAIRRTARIQRGEAAVAAVAYEALRKVGENAAALLRSSGMDASVLDDRVPEWRATINDVLLPAIEKVYAEGYASEQQTVTAAAEPLDQPQAWTGPTSLADHYASQYLTTAENRLVGVADTVYSDIAAALEEGRQRHYAAYTTADGTEVPERIGESIPELSKRVNALLSDEQRWRNRAVTIARTEVIGANNAGSHAAAAYNAGVLGSPEGAVQKEWLATPGPRTRESHAAASGERVLGLATPFIVGTSELQYPGDPSGPPGEVVNCRCTLLYHYPGDPEYTGPETASTSPTITPAASTTSVFDPATLQAALDPGSRRTAAAIQKDLAATPEGTHLAASIKQFTETRGGVANLRKNIAATVDGTASKAVSERTGAFLDALNTYPTDQVPTLYRGIAVKVDADTAEWWDAFEGQFKPGSKMTLNASSFTSSEAKAKEFQSMIGGTRKANSNYTAVRIVLQDNPHALPVEKLSKFKSEREWITGGDFEVVEYLPATAKQPYYRVVVRQVRSLEKP